MITYLSKYLLRQVPKYFSMIRGPVYIVILLYTLPLFF